MEFERGSTNVYADLGFPDADEMLVKAQLATKIGEIIKRRRLTQVEVAEAVACSLTGTLVVEWMTRGGGVRVALCYQEPVEGGPGLFKGKDLPRI